MGERIAREFPAWLSAWLSACLVLSLSACEFADSGGEKGGGSLVPASLTWMSTTLAGSSPVAKRGAPEAPYADTTGNYLSYRVTPSNMEGRLIQVSLMIGQTGEGRGGSALRLVGTEEGFHGSSVEKSSELEIFNMERRLTLSSGFRCCGSSYTADDMAWSGWFEILFAYVDATFSLPAGPLAGAHTVRAAFADIGDLGYRRGDLLYLTAEGYRWVDSATGTLAAARPAKPLRLGWVASYAGTSDGRGNQHIPPLYVAIQDSQKVYMPADTVLANAWELIADFVLRGGLIFRRTDPAVMTGVAELLSAFDFRADRDNASSGSDGISANFYALRTPLGSPRPDDFKDSLGNWILPPPDTLEADAAAP